MGGKAKYHHSSVQMAQKAIIIVLLFSYFPFSLSENYTLLHCCTAMSGFEGFPDYMDIEMVDGQDWSLYTSITKMKVPLDPFVKEHLDPKHWDNSTEESARLELVVTTIFDLIKFHNNETAGAHVFQMSISCWWDDKTHATGSSEASAYDGLDLVWSGPVAHVSNGLPGKDEREPKYLQECIGQLKKYVTSGKEYLNRKVPPDVLLFFSYSSNSSVVCHATGFYPKRMNITWRKDGQVMKEDVGPILPNGDGTFQIRAVITVSSEERKKSNFTCKVEHVSGLIIKILSEENGSSIVIVTVILPLIVIIVAGFGTLFWTRMRTQNETGLAPQRRQDKEAASECCVKFSDLNGANFSGSDTPLMTNPDNVPCYS
ncbi:major histocompatibility complex class I-related protein 1-like isoform X2 [Alosa pseudoharengus]|uniref:major histocompatibility complex class I-related protein 1-like isoform X2 n=1 Tax=Alosa pseudoharengus TaxID=34774 RepID=UPI003F8A0117